MGRIHQIVILVGIALLTVSITGLPIETRKGCNVTRLSETVRSFHENSSYTVTEDKDGCTAYVYSINDSRIPTAEKNHTILDMQDHDKDCKGRDPHSYDDGQHAGCVCMPKYYYDELVGMCTLCVPCCKRYNVTVHACINQGQRIDMCEQVKDCSEPDSVTDLRLGSITCNSIQVTWTQSPIGDTIWDAYQISIEATHGIGEDKSYMMYDPEYNINSYTTADVNVGESYKVTVTRLYGARQSYPNSVPIPTVPQCDSRLYTWLQDEKNGRGYIFFWAFIVLFIAAVASISGLVFGVYRLITLNRKVDQRLPGTDRESLLGDEEDHGPGDEGETSEPASPIQVTPEQGKRKETKLAAAVHGDNDDKTNSEKELPSPIEEAAEKDRSTRKNDTDTGSGTDDDDMQYSDARTAEIIPEDAQREQIGRINGAAAMNAEKSEGAPDDEEQIS